jgi:hypothetical protein
VAKFLYIFQFKFVKEPLDWRVRRRLNPYNPLTYLTLIITVVVVIVGQFFMACREVLTELSIVFKYD